jgi:hypothetical protein
MKKKTTEEFINDAKKVHGDRYDYSMVDYSDNRTNVKIICPIHGEFEQIPSVHLRGGGCNKCGQLITNKKNTKFRREMLDEVNKKFGTNYDWSQFEYNGYDAPSTVICPEHGEFQQTFHRLKYGHGCQHCGNKHAFSEKQVKKRLEEEFENVECQKKFPWLRYKKPLSLDFYLPNYNTAIEYQGRQHFSKYTKFADDFENVIERDKRKIQLCEENNIILYHLSFETRYIPQDFNTYKIWDNLDNIINEIKLGEK